MGPGHSGPWVPPALPPAPAARASPAVDGYARPEHGGPRRPTAAVFKESKYIGSWVDTLLG